jgi:hypothetical protein
MVTWFCWTTNALMATWFCWTVRRVRIRKSKDRERNGKKGQKDKQRPTKHTHKTKDRVKYNTPFLIRYLHVKFYLYTRSLYSGNNKWWMFSIIYENGIPSVKVSIITICIFQERRRHPVWCYLPALIIIT